MMTNGEYHLEEAKVRNLARIADALEAIAKSLQHREELVTRQEVLIDKAQHLFTPKEGHNA